MTPLLEMKEGKGFSDVKRFDATSKMMSLSQILLLFGEEYPSLRGGGGGVEIVREVGGCFENAYGYRASIRRSTKAHISEKQS